MIREAAKSNCFDTIPSDVYVRHYNTLKAIAKDHAIAPPDLDGSLKHAIWAYGSSRTGKSYWARNAYPGAFFKLANKWWDCYRGHDYVILDDFDACHECLGYHLKIWGDCYAFGAEVKGSTILSRPKMLIVTSNYHPRDIWGGKPQTLDAILERFHVIHFCKDDEQFVGDERKEVYRVPQRRGLAPAFDALPVIDENRVAVDGFTFAAAEDRLPTEDIW